MVKETTACKLGQRTALSHGVYYTTPAKSIFDLSLFVLAITGC